MFSLFSDQKHGRSSLLFGNNDQTSSSATLSTSLAYVQKVDLFETHAEAMGVDAKDTYKCPISMCIMRDPVVNAAGHTYEREELESAYRANATTRLTDPVTNAVSLSPFVCTFQE